MRSRARPTLNREEFFEARSLSFVFSSMKEKEVIENDNQKSLEREYGAICRVRPKKKMASNKKVVESFIPTGKKKNIGARQNKTGNHILEPIGKTDLTHATVVSLQLSSYDI